MFSLPSRSKAEHFLRRKGYFPKSARDVFCEKYNVKEYLKMKMENFLHHWKAEEKIRQKRLSKNFFK